MNSKKNILFVHEVASQAEILASYLICFHSDIYDVKRMMYFDHKYYKTQEYPKTVFDAGCDIAVYKSGIIGNIQTSWKIILFLWKYKKIILQADIIHFFSGSSFLPGNKDIFFLKKILKKKILMEYNGSEVRQPDFSKSINMFYKLSEGCNYCTDVQVQKKMKRLQGYFDIIIIPYPEMLLQIKNVIPDTKKKIIQFLPHIIDIPEGIQKAIYPQDINILQTFTIVHAPSNKNTKGSIYIEKIVRALQKKYPKIIYKELHNIPRNEVLIEIQNADCIIDQMLIGDFGIFALEALSYSTPVFCFLLDEVLSLYPKDIPIIHASILTLYSRLEYYFEHREQLRKIAVQSRNYVEKYHSQQIVGWQYNKIIESL